MGLSRLGQQQEPRSAPGNGLCYVYSLASRCYLSSSL